MMKKAIISIAAGTEQVMLIKKIKEMGFTAIAVDRDENAPGFEFADEKIALSTYEANPIIWRLSLLKEKYKFEGVITRSSGIPVITMSKIAKEFNLPGIAPAIAEKIVFKDKLMEECERVGIPAPEHQTVNRLEDIDWTKIEYPVVLKPALGIIGKKGVQRITTKDELIERFEATKKSSYNGYVDIESFEDGPDVTLMAFSVKGKLYPIVLLDEINRFDKNGFVEPIGIRIPSEHDKEKLEIYKFAQNVITKFNIGTSVFLMSCRYTHDKTIKLIEIHLDLGGDRILDDLLPRSSDMNFIKLAIQVCTDEEIEEQNFNFSPTMMMFKDKKRNDENGITFISAKRQEDYGGKIL